MGNAASETIKRVHHVGVVVRDLVGARTFWRDVLGLPLIREAELPDQGVRAVLLGCGSCEVELIEPTTPGTGVARFLARHGDGLHHLCFEVTDVGREVERLHRAEVDLIDVRPRKGLAGMIAFLHPRACAGVLVELATPLEHGPSAESPLAVTAVDATVEDVEDATRQYRELFGLPVWISHPDWSRAQLSVGGVRLELSSTRVTSRTPGLSMLWLMADDLDRVGARLDSQGAAVRREVGGLVLGPGVTHGVALVIHKPQAGEARA